MGKKWFISTYSYIAQSIMDESQSRNSQKARTWRQGLIQMPWWRTAGWLAPPVFFSLVSYNTLDHQPRDGTILIELGFHQPPIKKILHSITHRPFWWWFFVSWECLFLNDSYLGSNWYRSSQQSSGCRNAASFLPSAKWEACMLKKFADLKQWPG